MVDKYKPSREANDKLFNFMLSARLKSIATDKAVRQGRSVGGYIRFLIEQDNK